MRWSMVGRSRRRGTRLGEVAGGVFFEDGAEEVFFVLEVVVEGSAGLTGGRGDLFEAGVLEAVAGEDGAGGGEELPAGEDGCAAGGCRRASCSDSRVFLNRACGFTASHNKHTRVYVSLDEPVALWRDAMKERFMDAGAMVGGCKLEWVAVVVLAGFLAGCGKKEPKPRRGLRRRCR